MAKFYKYKTADELRAEAIRLGGTLELSTDYSGLFQATRFGTKTLGNRLCIQPMEGCDGTLDGQPDELTYRRYHRFGSGGAKLIWGEATAIASDARMNPRQLWLHEGSASSIEKMLAGCRQAHRNSFGNDDGLLLGLQLTHSGRYSFLKPQLACHDDLLDPRTIDKSTGCTIDSSYPLLTDDELKKIEDEYVLAAQWCAKIGCDFVDIKQCHRYLLSEFLAAKTRPGPYGGSLENRIRLVRNVIQRIKAESPSLIIVSRMNVYDGIPFAPKHRLPEEYSRTVKLPTDIEDSPNVGIPVPHQRPLATSFGVASDDYTAMDLTEATQVCQWMRDWGVAAINVSMGNPYANPHLVRPAEFAPIDGYDAPEHPLAGVLRHFNAARTIQSAVPELPVVGSGYSWLQDFSMQAGAANVRDGGCQIVGVGRGSLSHPDFTSYLQTHGTLNRKQVCRTFSYCTNLMRTKDHPLGQYPTGCPPFDKEAYGAVWKEIEDKRLG